MIIQNLLIYDFDKLFEILKEIEKEINYKVLKISEKDLSKIVENFGENYLLITNKKKTEIKNQLLVENRPIRLNKLIEKINIAFLKLNFNQQSGKKIGKYSIDINSRELKFNKSSLKLTEKECDLIIYLFEAKKPISIKNLQLSVWGHQSKLETHTVETHIYRLRKKILETFKDENFIVSKKNGYKIN